MSTVNITPAMRRIHEAYARQSFRVWIVGGAVRDAIMGVEPTDMDFATDATPEEQIYICGCEGFRYIPTGLRHGTVTVIVDDEAFEITTLRTEANHDGRHADVSFTRSIEDDLGRRDLTINAMAMDFTGELIDPYGGRADLEAKRVRFVGDPDERMREDYLRILRWLRFHARICPDAPYDDLTAKAVVRMASGLRLISRERVWSEISKTLSLEGGVNCLKVMQEFGIDKHIGLPSGRFTHALFTSTYTRDPITILVSYLRRTPGDISSLKHHWKLSNYECKKFDLITRTMNENMGAEEVMFEAAVNGEPLDIMIEGLRGGGRGHSVERLQSWTVPTFPVTGEDLLNAGLKPGPEMGTKLKDMKIAWARGNYASGREELLRDHGFTIPC